MTLARSIPAGAPGVPNSALPGEPSIPHWASRLVAGGVECALHRSGGAEFRTTDAGAAALVTARLPNAVSLNGERLRDATHAIYATIVRGLRTLRACHPVRFWNFIPRLHEPMGSGMDRYMVFNAGRFAALRGPLGSAQASDVAATVTQPIPTATGIGHAGADLAVYCLSMATPGRAIENPRQIPAYRYSPRYGPLPPCFSRATAVTLPNGREVLLVGGTASVVGEDSWHRDDVTLQFEETCLNLRSLIAAWDPAVGEDWATGFREVRSYAPAFPAPLGALVHRAFGGARHVEFVPAHLCRRELLIEIEGVVEGMGRGVPRVGTQGEP